MVFCRLFPSPAKAANMAVAVVPILLPKVNGNIRSRLITPIPTNGVRVEVNTLLLCTNIVIPTPIPINKYLKISSILANLFTNILNVN